MLNLILQRICSKFIAYLCSQWQYYAGSELYVMLQILCLRLTDEYERSVQIDVTVEEALTGRRQNTSFEVMLHKYKYKMELIKTSEYFKPGLKYTAYVSVLLPYEFIHCCVVTGCWLIILKSTFYQQIFPSYTRLLHGWSF